MITSDASVALCEGENCKWPVLQVVKCQSRFQQTDAKLSVLDLKKFSAEYESLSFSLTVAYGNSFESALDVLAMILELFHNT